MEWMMGPPTQSAFAPSPTLDVRISSKTRMLVKYYKYLDTPYAHI
jgi:hypothetical protein